MKKIYGFGILLTLFFTNSLSAADTAAEREALFAKYKNKVVLTFTPTNHRIKVPENRFLGRDVPSSFSALIQLAKEAVDHEGVWKFIKAYNEDEFAQNTICFDREVINYNRERRVFRERPKTNALMPSARDSVATWVNAVLAKQEIEKQKAREAAKKREEGEV